MHRVRTLWRVARPLLLVVAAIAWAPAPRSSDVLADEDAGASPAPPSPEKPDTSPEGGAPEDDADELFDAPTTFSREQVDQAIETGVRWLRSRQRPNGSWDDLSGDPGSHVYGGGKGPLYAHQGGVTSLAL